MNSCFLCAKGFIYIFLLNPHNNPRKQGPVFPFYRWWNCGLERLKNLYKAPQPMESQGSHLKWCLSGGSGFFCKLKIWHGQGSKSNSSQMPSPLLQRIVLSPFFTEPPPGEEREAGGRTGEGRWLNHLKSVLRSLFSIAFCFQQCLTLWETLAPFRSQQRNRMQLLTDWLAC